MFNPSLFSFIFAAIGETSPVILLIKLNQNNGVLNRYLCLFDKYHQGYYISQK